MISCAGAAAAAARNDLRIDGLRFELQADAERRSHPRRDNPAGGAQSSCALRLNGYWYHGVWRRNAA